MPIRVREQLLIWKEEYKRPLAREEKKVVFVLLFFVSAAALYSQKRQKKSGVSDRKIRTP